MRTALRLSTRSEAVDVEPTRRAPGHPIDEMAARSIVRDLVASGAGQQLATRLISDASAHGSAFASDHSLREAARTMLARAIVAAPVLPSNGATVAFVGPGGAGKTSCVAALASAYARASTLSVTVLSLGAPDGTTVLATKLRNDLIDVTTPAPGATRDTVEECRRGGLVVIDTEAVTPNDPAALQALAGELQPLALDAVFLALPATLSAAAARALLAQFAPLRPTALVITHADETDQLGVAIELSAVASIPLAYIHAGKDPCTAMTAVDPQALAARIIP